LQAAAEQKAKAKAREAALLLSQKLNAQLDDPKLWFLMFKRVDKDRSGRITHREFATMARDELRLAKGGYSEEEVELAWSALDTDGSGFLVTAEFAAFMRRGKGATGPTWKQRLQQQQDEKGRQARLDKIKTSGRRIILAEPASAEEMVHISGMLNALLDDPKLWFQMFMAIDADGSGKIIFDEFAGMLRDELRLGKAKLSDEKLESAWAALDKDKSGFIVADEFADFMKMGAGEAGPNWKERLQAAQDEKGRLAREAREAYGGKKVITAEPASNEEVLVLSQMMNAELKKINPDDPTLWFKMFTHMDDDGSGKITYYEFSGLVREELKLTKAKLAEAQLEAVWAALDVDKSGFINVDEFGDFMAKGAPEDGLTWKEKLQMQQVEKGRKAREENDAYGGKRVITAAAASPEEMLELSRLLNSAFGEGAEWFNVFTHIDEDGSGKIAFNEFADLLRNKLQVSKAKLPQAKLESAWAALDRDRSGFVVAQEFGDFMGRGAPKGGLTWKERLQQQQDEKGKAAREEAEEYGGKTVVLGEAASPEEMVELSKKFNDAMRKVNPDDPRLWYKMFMHVDDDGSGKITYYEFAGLVREELKLTKAKMPEAKLKAAWAALDTDKSGFITSDEFGMFMAKGTPDEGLTWKEKLQLEQDRKGKQAREENEAYGGNHISTAEPASPEEMLELSRLINTSYGDSAHGDSWIFNLFTHVDDDGSGKITFNEFAGMLREELKLSAAKVSEAQLEAAWAALDADKSGFVVVEEFGKFVQRGAPEDGPTWKERLQQRQDEKGRLAREEAEAYGKDE